MKACVEKWLTEQFCGDAGLVSAVYDEYRQTLSRLLEELAAARQGGQAKPLDKVLHTIKGSAAMVGDVEVSQLAAQARTLADPAELEPVEARLRQLLEEL